MYEVPAGIFSVLVHWTNYEASNTVTSAKRRTTASDGTGTGTLTKQASKHLAGTMLQLVLYW